MCGRSMSQRQNTVYVGNLSEKVTEELLYELFLQAGPVVNVTIPRQKPFGFVEFKHPCSVPYVVSLLEGTSLYGKILKIAPRGGTVMSAPPSHVLPQPFIHPLSQTGRLPSMEPRQSRKSERSDERTDLRDWIVGRSRSNDPMKPSGSPADRADIPFDKDIEAIPDFLGSAFDPLYSSGPVMPHRHFGGPYEDRGRNDRSHRRRDDSSDDRHNRRSRNDRHHHSQHDRRDRGPYHPSNRRKHF